MRMYINRLKLLHFQRKRVKKRSRNWQLREKAYESLYEKHRLYVFLLDHFGYQG